MGSVRAMFVRKEYEKNIVVFFLGVLTSNYFLNRTLVMCQRDATERANKRFEMQSKDYQLTKSKDGLFYCCHVACS